MITVLLNHHMYIAWRVNESQSGLQIFVLFRTNQFRPFSRLTPIQHR